MPGEDADLVVVGYGGAGAAAALRASELGASVLIIEKQAQDAHTPSTRMCGGHVMGVNDAELAATYLDRCAGGMVPLAVSRAWAHKAMTLVAWLDEQKTDLRLRRAYGAEHPNFGGAEAIDVYLQSKRKDGTPVDFVTSSSSEAQGAAPPAARDPGLCRGPELFAALARAVAGRPTVEVRWDSPATRLVREADRIAGVTLEDGETVRGRRGVILTTGGYEFDEWLKLNYLKAPDIHFYGNPGNTGDGVRMAQEVGADLWHMNLMIGRGIGHFLLPDGSPLNFSLGFRSGVWLDKHGKRFTNEARQMLGLHDVYYDLLEYDPQAHDYPRIPSYWFFDQSVISQGPLTPRGAVEVGLYDWSADNTREIEQGWILEGDSIEAVAAKAGIDDPAAAAGSVREFNQICARRSDPLGRPSEMLTPLDGPPYYCVPLYPGGPNTTGGPRRNERAEVLTPFGETIPGLYAAGELGAAYGLLYPSGGCNLSDAFCFGQIAAETALNAG